VGVFAVQLAKVHWGAYVVATGGPKNQSFLTKVRLLQAACDGGLGLALMLHTDGPCQAAHTSATRRGR
jgi:hypothetical protein